MNSWQARPTIGAGMIGNGLEWYDFAIYGYLKPQGGLGGVNFSFSASATAR